MPTKRPTAKPVRPRLTRALRAERIARKAALPPAPPPVPTVRGAAALGAIYARIRARNSTLYDNGAATPADPGEWGIRTRHETDQELFEELCFHLFAAGFSREVTRSKWPALTQAFARFDPAVVAGFDATELRRLGTDAALIRNRRKIAATVANAGTVLELAAAHGSFGAWLRSFPATELYRLHRELEQRFHGIGVSAAQWFLLTSGFPYYFETPDAQRLLRRLNLIGERARPAQLSALMWAMADAAGTSPWLVSAELYRFASGFHMHEAICQDQAPRCPKCPLWDDCAYFNQQAPAAPA